MGSSSTSQVFFPCPDIHRIHPRGDVGSWLHPLGVSIRPVRPWEMVIDYRDYHGKDSHHVMDRTDHTCCFHNGMNGMNAMLDLIWLILSIRGPGAKPLNPLGSRISACTDRFEATLTEPDQLPGCCIACATVLRPSDRIARGPGPVGFTCNAPWISFLGRG